MTSHELAALLLSKPDETVVISVYVGGEDELMEIKDIRITESAEIELITYEDIKSCKSGW